MAFLPSAAFMAWLYRMPGLIVAMVLSSLVSIVFGLGLATGKYGMQISLRGSLAALLAAVTSALPILPLVYYSPLPSLANVLVGTVAYLVAYLTLAPLFKAIRLADFEILAPIFGQIRFLKPIANLIFAYETRVLKAVERETK